MFSITALPSNLSILSGAFILRIILLIYGPIYTIVSIVNKFVYHVYLDSLETVNLLGTLRSNRRSFSRLVLPTSPRNFDCVSMRLDSVSMREGGSDVKDILLNEAFSQSTLLFSVLNKSELGLRFH